jgi:hypothetical protein
MDIVNTQAQRPERANDEAGFRNHCGTARQMGLEVVD